MPPQYEAGDREALHDTKEKAPNPYPQEYTEFVTEGWLNQESSQESSEFVTEGWLTKASIVGSMLMTLDRHTKTHVRATYHSTSNQTILKILTKPQKHCCNPLQLATTINGFALH